MRKSPERTCSVPWSRGTGPHTQISQLAGFFNPNSVEKNSISILLVLSVLFSCLFFRKKDALTMFHLKCKFPASEFLSIIRLSMLGYSVVTNNLKMARNNIGLFSAHAACSAWVSRGLCVILTPSEGAATIWNIAGSLDKVKKTVGGSCSYS